jgi:hypothetical protein
VRIVELPDKAVVWLGAVLHMAWWSVRDALSVLSRTVSSPLSRVSRVMTPLSYEVDARQKKIQQSISRQQKLRMHSLAGAKRMMMTRVGLDFGNISID